MRGPIKSLCWIITFSLLMGSDHDAKGQISGIDLTGQQENRLPVSVPFLTIAPDGRSAGTGDAGAASTPDVNAQHWNPAKYAFAEGKGGVALTYSPWAPTLLPGIAHLYMAGYFKINARSAVSTSLRYFSLGTVTFSAVPGGAVKGVYHPGEFAVDAGYSRKFTERLSGGIVLRHIRSDLTEGSASAGGQETRPGISFAGDLGLYYQDNMRVGEKDAQWAFGFHISNAGTPVSYTVDAAKIPIPANLRVGGRFTFHINQYNRFSLLADLNKLLVPTPGVYGSDSATGDMILIRGKGAPGSVVQGMFRSFYDAPGVPRPDGTYSVIAEEFHEIAVGLGAEYLYRQRWALRSGYYHEHPSKGNRSCFTFGMGARYRFLALDISYALPLQPQTSTLKHTFRFTLAALFGIVD